MSRASLNPITHVGSFTPAPSLLQRQCSCGNRTAGGATCEECSKKKNSLQRQMRVGSSNDPLEHQADRVADQVLANQTAPAISSFSFGKIQRQDKPEEKTNEEKYKEGGKKIGEAFLKTPIGKELLDTVKEGALGNWTGRIITGSAAIGTVVALAASEEELPMQVPEIPLDFITPGLSVEIAYKGPVNKPTSAMLTFKYAEQAPGSGSASKAPSAYAIETARMAAEQAKFKANMIFKPGSPEDLQQKAEKEAIHNVVQKISGGFDIEAAKKKYPGLATPESKPGLSNFTFKNYEIPTPASEGLKLTPPTFDYGYKLKPIFSDQLKLKSPEEMTLEEKKIEEEKKKKSTKTSVQKKLSIGSSNDPLEAEADRIADQVVGNSVGTTSIRSSAISSVQRHSSTESQQTDDVPESVNQTLSSSGKPLDKTIRTDMESRFGHDFSHVRIHQGSTAEKSARDINANAYTAGNNIVFDSGKFSPETSSGKHLLAHELTHVIQQSSERPSNLQRDEKTEGDEKITEENSLDDEDVIDDYETGADNEKAPEEDIRDEEIEEPDRLPSGDEAEPMQAGGAPKKGKWILVKLPGTLFRFDGKKRIDAWGISGGKAGHETPEGRFSISTRDEDHKSSIYGKCGSRKVSGGAASCKKGEKYVGADMGFYQQFAPAVGFHRGNPNVLSHGCIHVSGGNAKTLWNWSTTGTTVIVCKGSGCDPYTGKTAPTKKKVK